MPTPRNDSVLIEFEFTVQEALAARALTPLQIQWYQTKYAQLFKEKASSIIPEDTGLDRSFLLRLGEIEGKLNMLQEIFGDHANMLKELSDPNKPQATGVEKELVVDTLAKRASDAVNTNQS